jgi:hypothetical protein
VNWVIRATRDGELFIFVNYAVVGIRGLYDVFYRNNGGAADRVVMRRDARIILEVRKDSRKGSPRCVSGCGRQA